MAEPGSSNPMRWVVLSLAAAGLFAVGLVLYIQSATQRAQSEAKAEAEAMFERMEKQGTPLLDTAAAVAAPFVAHVGGARFAEAHALLATPYRHAVSVAQLASACRASPILAAARSITLREVRQQSAGAASTVEARGILDSAAGAVPIAIVFLREPTDPELRILTVTLAGVPVLQGVTATPR